MLVSRMFIAFLVYLSDTTRDGSTRAGTAGLRHKYRHKGVGTTTLEAMTAPGGIDAFNSFTVTWLISRKQGAVSSAVELIECVSLSGPWVHAERQQSVCRPSIQANFRKKAQNLAQKNIFKIQKSAISAQSARIWRSQVDREGGSSAQGST